MSRQILTIDDSDIAQDVIRATLVDFGFENVVSYLDPTEALSAISAAEISADLVLLDIMMPEMDGIELCARIRGLAKWTDVPIIMLTSRKDMDSLTQAFLAGANDYVTKPFDRIELQARIRSSLRLKSELDRRHASDRRSESADRTYLALAPAHTKPELDIGIMAGRAALLSALHAVPADRVGKLGLVAFELHRPDADGDPGAADPAAVRAAADVLASFQIAAGDLFAHWDGGMFCFATLDMPLAALFRAAERFVRDFGIRAAELPEYQSAGAMKLSAGVVPSGGAATVATRLADAIRTCERAGRAEPGSIRVFDANGKEA